MVVSPATLAVKLNKQATCFPCAETVPDWLKNKEIHKKQLRRADLLICLVQQ